MDAQRKSDSMYEEFDAVLLKDGRFASLDDKAGPGVYTGTVGYGPKTWEIVYLTDDDIKRLATPEEIELDAKKSEQELRELGYV